MNTEIIKIQPGDGPVSEEDDAKLKAAGEILRQDRRKTSFVTGRSCNPIWHYPGGQYGVDYYRRCIDGAGPDDPGQSRG